MVLDAVTVRNLELLEPIFAADAGAPQAQLTVLGVLDQTEITVAYLAATARRG